MPLASVVLLSRWSSHFGSDSALLVPAPCHFSNQKETRSFIFQEGITKRDKKPTRYSETYRRPNSSIREMASRQSKVTHAPAFKQPPLSLFLLQLTFNDRLIWLKKPCCPIWMITKEAAPLTSHAIILKYIKISNPSQLMDQQFLLL